MINLLAPEMKRQIRAARNNVTLGNYCVLLSLTAGLAAIAFSAGYWMTIQERQSATANQAVNKQASVNYADTRKQAEDFRQDLQQAKTILASDISFYNLITRIAAVVPSGVILNNLSLGTAVQTTPITISARTVSYEKAVELKNKLAELPIFTAVTLNNATTSAADSNRDPIGARYPVTAQLLATMSKNFGKGAAQ